MSDFPDKKKRSLFSQLHILLTAGMGFTRSFSMVAEGFSGKDRELMERLLQRVIKGGDLWEAFRQEKDFTALDCGITRIGEETGRLPEALSFLSGYYARKEEQRRMIVGTLSYPVITLIVAGIVLIFMMLVVVPMFEQVYLRMGGNLPALTQMMIRLSRKAPVMLVWMVACLSMAYGLHRKWTSYVLHIPLAGPLVRQYQVARFSSVLHLLVSSEVPLLRALRLMQDVMTFEPYRHSLETTIERIQNGESLTDALEEQRDLYGQRFLAMIRVGEETNSLPCLLETLARDTSEEMDYSIRQLNTILEPLLILLVGILVGFVLVAMYLPMFKLGLTIG